MTAVGGKRKALDAVFNHDHRHDHRQFYNLAIEILAFDNEPDWNRGSPLISVGDTKHLHTVDGRHEINLFLRLVDARTTTPLSPEDIRRYQGTLDITVDWVGFPSKVIPLEEIKRNPFACNITLPALTAKHANLFLLHVSHQNEAAEAKRFISILPGIARFEIPPSQLNELTFSNGVPTSHHTHTVPIVAYDVWNQVIPATDLVHHLPPQLIFEYSDDDLKRCPHLRDKSPYVPHFQASCFWNGQGIHIESIAGQFPFLKDVTDPGCRITSRFVLHGGSLACDQSFKTVMKPGECASIEVSFMDEMSQKYGTPIIQEGGELPPLTIKYLDGWGCKIGFRSMLDSLTIHVLDPAHPSTIRAQFVAHVNLAGPVHITGMYIPPDDATQGSGSGAAGAATATSSRQECIYHIQSKICTPERAITCCPFVIETKPKLGGIPMMKLKSPPTMTTTIKKEAIATEALPDKGSPYKVRAVLSILERQADPYKTEKKLTLANRIEVALFNDAATGSCSPLPIPDDLRWFVTVRPLESVVVESRMLTTEAEQQLVKGKAIPITANDKDEKTKANQMGTLTIDNPPREETLDNSLFLLEFVIISKSFGVLRVEWGAFSPIIFRFYAPPPPPL